MSFSLLKKRRRMRKIQKELGIYEDSKRMQQAKVSLIKLRDICLSLEDLVERAAEDNVPSEEREMLQAQADELTAEYNSIVSRTDFEARERILHALNQVRTMRLH